MNLTPVWGTCCSIYTITMVNGMETMLHAKCVYCRISALDKNTYNFMVVR